jgi:adenosylmethionine-8-amino-7-oxononanoate aminotransferase
MTPPMSLAAQRDIRHILHPWQHLSLERCREPLIIERAEGAYVFDSRGRRYLDAVGRVSQLAERRGLLVRSCGHVNIISPCLASTPAQVDCIVDVLADSLDELCQGLDGC